MVAKTTSMTSSTTLSGVDAPEVTPMTTSTKSQSAVCTSTRSARLLPCADAGSDDGVGVGVHAIARVDPVAGNGFILADLLEVGGVGGVEATDDEHDVGLFDRRVCTWRRARLLGLSSPGVHDDEMIGDVLHAVLFHHRLFKELTDGLGLALEHGGLIGDADAFGQSSGSKPCDMAFLNFSINSALSPPFKMYSRTYVASFISLTIKYLVAKLAVATVSS